MSQLSPLDVFSEAQSAMARGDYDTFFKCFNNSDLMGIAKNSVSRLMSSDDTFSALREILGQHSVSHASFDNMLEKLTEMIDSSSPPIDDDYRQRQQRVKAFNNAMSTMLKSAANLAGLTAALEKAMRSMRHAGSVSRSLFIDEVLEQIVIEDNKAWATRKIASGHSEDIGFIKKKGQWYIRLMARKPKRLQTKQ